MTIRRILVVDDSPTERQYLTELLADRGFEVLVAASADEGIEKARREAPDLILMDIIMPGTSGFQATREIIRDEGTKHIPIIMCTSKAQESDKIWGMRQGACAYLTKPIDSAQLFARIATLG